MNQKLIQNNVYQGQQQNLRTTLPDHKLDWVFPCNQKKCNPDYIISAYKLDKPIQWGVKQNKDNIKILDKATIRINKTKKSPAKHIALCTIITSPHKSIMGDPRGERERYYKSENKQPDELVVWLRIEELTNITCTNNRYQGTSMKFSGIKKKPKKNILFL